MTSAAIVRGNRLLSGAAEHGSQDAVLPQGMAGPDTCTGLRL